MSAAAFPFRHLLLALLIVSIWGANFVAVKIALRELPPLLLCALRFIAVVVPFIFFVPRPAVTLRQLLGYGLTMFALQFGFLFFGMKLGMPAGLTSLVLQFQVFVTLALAAVVLKERISPAQIAGALIACAGFAIVALHTDGEVTAAGLGCLLLAATSWGYANFSSKRLGRVNPLSLVVWGSLVVPLPMMLASLIFEGPGLIAHSLTHLHAATLWSVAYIVYGSTLVGYSLWSWLLSRHPASTVTPFALLVPVSGMLSSAIVLGEPLPVWKLQAGALVIAGLALNIFGPRLPRILPAARMPAKPSGL
ncbi:MAG: EamA family transporter [Undibacterium sp.]|nr:EamA family transporter [Opitutaceae bacterium]